MRGSCRPPLGSPRVPRAQQSSSGKSSRGNHRERAREPRTAHPPRGGVRGLAEPPQGSQRCAEGSLLSSLKEQPVPNSNGEDTGAATLRKGPMCPEGSWTSLGLWLFWGLELGGAGGWSAAPAPYWEGGLAGSIPYWYTV